MKTILKVENISFSYGEDFSLKNVSLSVNQGTFYGIIGPNGSGKTTLLSIVMGFLKPKVGNVIINGMNKNELSPKQLARQVAYIAQDFNTEYDFTVEDIVEMGDLARRTSFFNGEHNKELLLKALEMVGLVKYRYKLFSALSGGEQRRVLIARAIYQDTPIIVADEMTTHLDIGQSIKIVEHLKELSIFGKTIIGTFHDIGLAAKYCDKIAVMKKGEIVAVGNPNEVINEKLLKDVYDAEVKVINDGYPIIVI